jgi:hypothetical protein
VPDILGQALPSDVPECMRRVFESSPALKDLTGAELEALKVAIDQAPYRANVSRMASQLQMNGIRTRADIPGPVDPGDFPQRSLALMRKLGASEVQIRQAIRGMATPKQKLKLLSNYQNLVRQQIDGLRSIASPVVPDTD